MKKQFLTFSILFGFAAIFSSCHDDHNHDDDHKHNEEEMINQVQLNLNSDGSTQVVKWVDEDGDGGNNPVLPDTLYLNVDSSYSVMLEFSHIHDGETKSINPEIKDESNDHLVCFTNSVGGAIQIMIDDEDGNGLSLGLQSTWKAIDSTSSMMKIALKHQPGIKNGQCDLGETDVEVEFPIVIK
jgi:hypothetical protein